jgi:hypothetical protein
VITEVAMLATKLDAQHSYGVKIYSPSIDESSQVSLTDTRRKRDSSAYGAIPKGVSDEKELQWMVNPVVAASGEVVLLMTTKSPYSKDKDIHKPSGMVPPPFD